MQMPADYYVSSLTTSSHPGRDISTNVRPYDARNPVCRELVSIFP